MTADLGKKDDDINALYGPTIQIIQGEHEVFP